MKIILNNYPAKVPRLNLTIQSLQSLQFLRVCTSPYHWNFQFSSHFKQDENFRAYIENYPHIYHYLKKGVKFLKSGNSQFSRSSNNKNSFSICYCRVTMSRLLQVTKLGPAGIGRTEFCYGRQVATSIPTSKYDHTVLQTYCGIVKDTEI